MVDPKKSIFKTLIYADIFDYPLIKEELWKFLISSTPIQKNKFEQALEKLKSYKGYYFLPGRKNIIEKRISREKESERKFKIARRTSFVLSFIPTIQLIGISGGLAMGNVEDDDDIDLFIIAKKNTLWTTRLVIIIFLELLGVRRRRNEKSSPDKICINMLMDESALSFPKNKQNLYMAHEIVQMKTLSEHNNTYEKFIGSNKWIKKFLPNTIDRGITRTKTQNHAVSDFLRTLLRFSALEQLTKAVQRWYMGKHQTTEIVNDKVLAFHPFDYGQYVMREYNKRLRAYGL